MKWLERHLGRYAISNLSMYVAVLQTIGFALELMNSDILNYISLSPYHILHGQIWRLVTWVLVPPTSSSYWFVPIAILFYYSIGMSLERTWGVTRYNIYILGGVVFTIVGAFVTYGLTILFYGSLLSPFMSGLIAGYFTTYYVLMSIFLAYAATFPNAIVLFMFILPIRVKWLGVLYAAGIVYSVYNTWRALSAMNMGFITWIECASILASLLNFLIFFLTTRDWRSHSPREIRRRNAWRRGMQQGRTVNGRWREMPDAGNAGSESGMGAPVRMKAAASMHRCAICGRTEITNPDLEFRYCSKCEGGYEYCQDHLFTHIHARNGSAPTLMEGQDITLEPGNGGDPAK